MATTTPRLLGVLFGFSLLSLLALDGRAQAGGVTINVGGAVTAGVQKRPAAPERAEPEQNLPLFYNETFARTPEGSLPKGWSGGDKLLVKAGKDSHYLTSAPGLSEGTKTSVTVGPLDFPEDWRFEWTENQVSGCDTTLDLGGLKVFIGMCWSKGEQTAFRLNGQEKVLAGHRNGQRLHYAVEKKGEALRLLVEDKEVLLGRMTDLHPTSFTFNFEAEVHIARIRGVDLSPSKPDVEDESATVEAEETVAPVPAPVTTTFPTTTAHLTFSKRPLWFGITRAEFSRVFPEFKVNREVGGGMGGDWRTDARFTDSCSEENEVSSCVEFFQDHLIAADLSAPGVTDPAVMMSSPAATEVFRQLTQIRRDQEEGSQILFMRAPGIVARMDSWMSAESGDGSATWQILDATLLPYVRQQVPGYRLDVTDTGTSPATPAKGPLPMPIPTADLTLSHRPVLFGESYADFLLIFPEFTQRAARAIDRGAVDPDFAEHCGPYTGVSTCVEFYRDHAVAVDLLGAWCPGQPVHDEVIQEIAGQLGVTSTDQQGTETTTLYARPGLRAREHESVEAGTRCHDVEWEVVDGTLLPWVRSQVSGYRSEVTAAGGE